MTDEAEPLSPINFTFTYTRHGWAHASVSDGTDTYAMDPSYVPEDPLFGLVTAVVQVLAYGGRAGRTWFYEPAADRWTLRREGDALHISIRQLREDYKRPDWPTDDRGDLEFSTTCDVWKFAAKVRLAVSRLEPSAEGDYHDPTRIQEAPAYRVLCTLLEEHKRAQRPPSA